MIQSVFFKSKEIHLKASYTQNKLQLQSMKVGNIVRTKQWHLPKYQHLLPPAALPLPTLYQAQTHKNITSIHITSSKGAFCVTTDGPVLLTIWRATCGQNLIEVPVVIQWRVTRQPCPYTSTQYQSQCRLRCRNYRYKVQPGAGTWKTRSCEKRNPIVRRRVSHIPVYSQMTVMTQKWTWHEYKITISCFISILRQKIYIYI